MLDKIRDVICEFIDIDPGEITPESNLRTDIGLNSLDCVSLAQKLENVYNIEIPNAELSKFKTVNDIIKYLETK
ncbi:MAG: acyl carrier protein [Clostridia bacterium]|nr:acyl carrier protein [Clostridia bacterium]